MFVRVMIALAGAVALLSGCAEKEEVKVEEAKAPEVAPAPVPEAESVAPVADAAPAVDAAAPAVEAQPAPVQAETNNAAPAK